MAAPPALSAEAKTILRTRPQTQDHSGRELMRFAGLTWSILARVAGQGADERGPDTGHRRYLRRDDPVRDVGVLGLPISPTCGLCSILGNLQPEGSPAGWARTLDGLKAWFCPTSRLIIAMPSCWPSGRGPASGKSQLSLCGIRGILARAAHLAAVSGGASRRTGRPLLAVGSNAAPTIDTSFFAAVLIGVGYERIIAGGNETIQAPGQASRFWTPFLAYADSVARSGREKSARKPGSARGTGDRQDRRGPGKIRGAGSAGPEPQPRCSGARQPTGGARRGRGQPGRRRTSRKGRQSSSTVSCCQSRTTTT